VYIRSDLSGILGLLWRQAILIAAVLLVSLAAALLMSAVSQRAVSRPIVHLADTARRVSEAGDYSIRAPNAGLGRPATELTILTEAFNEMLAQIQSRDRALQHARDDLERRVRDRTAALTEANSELEAFSYSVSHDLRAPLRHIGGFASLLSHSAGADLNEKSRRYLQTICDAAAQMGRLIDDLLAFSRMSRSELARGRVDLDDLVRDVKNEVHTETGRKVVWTVGPLPAVTGDRSMLRLVFVNMLSNALKYTRTREVAEIEIGAVRQDGFVIVHVTDNGVGFDMQYVDRLFGVFQRLHRAEEFEGTGIGLANVRRIIRRHGGDAWAEGRVDQGATFYVSIPWEETREGVAAGADLVAASGAGRA
jgi:signal transduction histidine kinase